tara:strand:- start:734 stop:1825 length:1092 start_codon:yes stop_codon:yes gene_type:complete
MTSDDPALTAFVLGELSENEAAEANRVLKDDENLLEEKETLTALTELLSDILGAESHSLGEERIAEIHRAGNLPDSNVLVLEHRRRSRRQSFLAVGGVAAVVFAGFLALSQFDGGQPNVVVDGNDGRVVGKGTPAGVSESLSGELELLSGDEMVIPLALSKADPSFVERALLAKGELPEPEKFRIADWVNLSVVEFEPLISMRELEAYAECGPCPWNSAKSLWMIRICSVNSRMISPVAKVVFDPEFVTSAHLVGGGETGGGGAFKSEGFGSSQIFLYELETKTEGDQLGGFSITTDQGESGYLPILSPQQIKESPTVGFRVAVVLGGFARWAGSDTREKETLLRLAREARELLAREEVTDTS